MPHEVRNTRDFIEKLILLLLVCSFLLGLCLIQWRRQRPSFALRVVSENPPFPVAPPTVPLNSATAEELSLLPGIGPKLAERIVFFRSRQGSFAALEELQKVEGIGPKLYQKILPFLRLQ